MRTALRAAFLRTGYEAGGVVVRIGRRSGPMDALLRRRGARAAGFVTAWNPFSRPMPLGWNRRLQARLREAARGDVLAEDPTNNEGIIEAKIPIAEFRKNRRIPR